MTPTPEEMPRVGTKRSAIINISILVLTFGVIVGYLVVTGDWRHISTALTTLSPLWMAVAVGLLGVYLLCEVGMITIALRMSGDRLPLLKKAAIAALGQLYGLITPLQSGSQPAQLYYMSRFGIPSGRSAFALFSKFVIFQIMVTLFAAVVLVARYQYFTDTYGSVVALSIPAFALHFAIVIGLISLAASPRSTERFVMWFVGIYARFRKSVDVDEARAKAHEQLGHFSDSLSLLKEHVPSLLAMAGVTTVQLIAFYLIPAAIIRALHLPVGDLVTTVAAAAFVLMIQTAMPLPGGSGAAEGGFATFFNLMFPSSTLVVIALLIWRTITLVLPIVIGVIFLFVTDRMYIELPGRLSDEKDGADDGA